MTIFKYQPIYKYNGPTLVHPYEKELTEKEIENNKQLFFENIHNQFTDIKYQIVQLEDGIIQVTADISQDDCDARVEKCLRKYKFCGKRATAEDLIINPNSIPN